MKPEFMRLRRAFAGTVAALLLAVGIVALSPALSASAHNYTVTSGCETGLSVNLTSYPPQTQVTVVIDGSTETDTTFGGNWAKTYTWNKNVDHSYTVTVLSPDDLDGSRNWSFTKSGNVAGCPPADQPNISASATSCSQSSAAAGTIGFTLSGVTKTYTVTLLSGTTTKATTTSTGGSGSFTNVSPGTYTVRASVSGWPSATSGPVTVTTCAQTMPDIDLVAESCVTIGGLGTVLAHLSNLVAGTSYTLTLYSGAGIVLDTVTLTATSSTHSSSFPGHGPGEYYVEVAGAGFLAESSHVDMPECAADFAVTVQLEACSVFQTGPDRAISVAIDGMTASTVYTVRLVTADAAATEIASTTTPGDSATTFAYTFTAVPVPVPGDYKVLVSGGTDTFESDSITTTDCDLDTLAPPSIELLADQCDGSGTGIDALTARLIDLDATRTYYVRIVDSTGATAPGGADRMVTGSTTATVVFPDVTATGTYTAQLFINPGMQLAATSPAAIDFTVCLLPTLALTGPGVLIPLGSVAALLLTLGGAIVTGRLRRRMAL